MGFRMILPKRVKKVKSKSAQEVLDRLNGFLESADVVEKPVEFLCGFWKDQQTAITYQELREAVLAGYIGNEILQQWRQDYSYLVKTQLNDMWVNAMQAGAVKQPIVEAVAGGFTFQTQSPGILSWLDQRGAEFVTSCTQQQKDAIAALLSKKMIEGHTVDELSRMIRPCIGLTAGQAKANVRYYDSIVENLKKEHPRMKPESIQRKARDAAIKYAERQRRQRAMTIAQTESAFAYNRGADEGIRQGQSQGLVGKVVKRWSTSGDDQVCSVCQGLEGVEVGMDSGFQFQGKLLFAGQDLLPPAHPRCACAVEYIEVESPKYTDGNSVEMPVEEIGEAHDRFGLFTNNNPSDERFYDYKGKSLQQVEKEISERNYETAVCFDKNGKAIYAQVGNEDSVRFTKIQCYMMKGADVTHNHPYSTPPSPEDLYLLKDYKANSFRAAGKYGAYVLMYSKELENLPEFDMFSKEFDSITNRLSPKYKDMVRQGMNEFQALRLLGEETWKILTKKYGIQLFFEERL